jgi:nucleotide-binding universal stress UspA family protein|tara:strand:+ start:4789 stop:5667 length:879 start_codon:yes stop_codon:yes gene_type:complete
MKSIKNILVAVDFTNADEVLLRYTELLTKKLEVTQVSFTHVVPRLDFFKTLTATGRENWETVWEINKNVTQELIIKVHSSLPEFNGEINCEVLEGEPLAELLSKANTSDLVLIGQREHTDNHGILARNLARKAKGNAFIIPENSTTNVRKVLVPVDFSDNSGRALQETVNFAKALNPDVEITVLNVFELPNLSTYRLSKTPEQFREIVVKNTNLMLDSFLRKYVPNQKINKAIVQMDLPSIGHYIVKYAVRYGIDLIGIGAKGHSTVELLFIGSVVEKVLNYNQQVPVLIIR